MAEKTGIAWTDHTFNIAWGCMKVSPGCAHCYADTLSSRYGFDVWGPPAKTTRRTFGAKHWKDPMKWNAAAAKAGVRRRVFCSSMCDVFEDHPTIDAEREKLWPLIRATPWLDWQLLTKRPERIHDNLPADWCDDGYGYPNVWLGTSIESDEYIGRALELIDIVARVRFISVEPMLGPVTFGQHWPYGRILDAFRWVIVGGESGSGHREMPLDACLAVVDEVRDAGAKVFVKQDSGSQPGQQGRIPDDYWIQEMPD